MKLNNDLISRRFDLNLKLYGITGKKLSEVTGVSQNHISEFRRGKGSVSTEVLAKLVEGMEAIAPGAGENFWPGLVPSGGLQSARGFGEQLELLVEAADEEEVEKLLLLIARKWRQVTVLEKAVPVSA